MPRGLAIETSGRTGSVAISSDGRVVAEREFAHGLQNAAKILPIIDALCAESGWTPRDLGEVYVSIGPGSFTGLRVGVTIAKTLAFATSAKVVAVPSVAVLARNAPAEARNVVIVLDAKRGQIFTSRFQRGSDTTPMNEIEAPHLDTLDAVLRRCPRPVHLVGEGIPFHLERVDTTDPTIIVTDQRAWTARAAIVAELGHGLARRGEFVNPDVLAPLYIRLPEAEEKWLAAHGPS